MSYLLMAMAALHGCELMSEVQAAKTLRRKLLAEAPTGADFDCDCAF